MKRILTPTLLTSAMALLLAPNLEAQTTPAPQPSGICTRACWSARAPNCQPGNINALTRAIIHHTAGSEFNTTGLASSQSYMRGIQNYDMDVNGWCDFSYHFTVDKFGNLFEGRQNSMSGLPKAYHDSYNYNSFSFTLLGYFHPPVNNWAPQVMLDRFYDVIAWRMPSGWSPYGSGTYNGRTVGVLDGHRKVKATACPGDNIHPNLITENYYGGTMRTSVANRRTGAPPPSSPNPVLIPNTDGRLEAFAVWSDNSVVHNWQTAPNSGWFGWDTLTGNGVVKVAAGRNLNGNLVSFCIGGTSLYQNYWNGSTWSGWQLLGGSITDLSVTTIADGRLEVFTANTDGSASHIWQTAPNSTTWSVWSSLSGNGINRVAAARNANGNLVCFCIGGTSLYRNDSNGSSWSGWNYMGGSLTEIAVASHTDGRLELFSRNTDGSASHVWQSSPNSSWSGWDSLGGNGINKIAVGRNQNGRLEVFCTGGTTLYHNWWTGTSWTGWYSLGGTINSLAVGSNLDGRLEVFARQVADGQMIHIYQTSPNGAWSSWYGMGGSFK